MTSLFRYYSVDFGKTATEYATHRAGFPKGFYERLSDYFGLLKIPSKVLDLGAGTGTISRQLASEGHHVTALDLSPEMLDECRRLENTMDKQYAHTVHPITYCAGVTAENTGIQESGSFDLVFAGQCWFWFDASKALAEVERLLSKKASSRVVLANFDWLLLSGLIGRLTDDLICKYNPTWSDLGYVGLRGTGFYPQWTVDLHEAGFSDIETFSFVENVVYTHDAWVGRMRACSGIGAGRLTEQQVAEFEIELRAELQKYPNPITVPHRCFAIVSKPPGVGKDGVNAGKA